MLIKQWRHLIHWLLPYRSSSFVVQTTFCQVKLIVFLFYQQKLKSEK